MKPETQLQTQLNKWLGLNNPELKTHEYNKHHKGRHALRSYKAIVEFPQHMGGGVVWYKSSAAARQYEARGCKVVWLIKQQEQTS